MNDSPSDGKATPVGPPPRTAVVELKIPSNSRRFDGHFPETPIYPAVAQLIDLILPQVREVFGGGALQGLKGVKWTKTIGPGDELVVLLRENNLHPNWIQFEIQSVEVRVCRGQLLLEPDPLGEDVVFKPAMDPKPR